MDEREASKGAAWKAADFAGEEKLPDDRLPCPHCAGAGLVREWSTFFFLQTLVGFGLALACVIRAITSGEAWSRFSWLAFFALCVGVFGLFMLIDRGECKTCGGMGRLEAEDQDEGEADLDREWADHPPPD